MHLLVEANSKMYSHDPVTIAGISAVPMEICISSSEISNSLLLFMYSLIPT